MVKVDVSLYGTAMLACSDKTEFLKACKRMKIEDVADIGACSGVTQPFITKDKQFGYLIGVFDKDPMTLIHECTHVAIFIADATGWEVSDTTSEPFCYLLEYLVKHSQSILES